MPADPPPKRLFIIAILMMFDVGVFARDAFSNRVLAQSDYEGHFAFPCKESFSVFFASQPETRAPTVAKIRIISVSPNIRDENTPALAEVTEVIRGTIEPKIIRIGIGGTARCVQPITVGQSGIVIGNLIRNPGDEYFKFVAWSNPNSPDHAF